MAGPWAEVAIDHLAQQIDYNSATIQYIGFASPGALTNEARWAIRRVTLDSSSRPIKVEWASGNSNYEQIWDSRVSLVYR